MLLSFFFSSILGAPTEDAQITLKSQKTIGSPAGMIFIQGAQIKNDRYSPLMTQIQNDAAYPLHIAIPSFPLDLAVTNVDVKIQEARDSLKQIDKDMPIFIAGHSLGAAMALNESFARPDKYAGVVILGASMLRKFNYNFPIPVLSLNGELDGLHRVSRVAEAFHNLLKPKDGNLDQDAFKKNPVIVLEGINHLQFSDGKNAPATVKLLDLEPDKSNSEALQDISRVVNQFLCLQHGSCNQQSSEESISEAIHRTYEFLKPMLSAFRLEGAPHLYTICNSDIEIGPNCPWYPAWPLQPNRTIVYNPNCFCGTPWAAVASQIMSGLDPEKYPVLNADAQHEVSDEHPFHHAHFWTNCTEKSTPCAINHTTVSQPMYDTFPFNDKDDTGFSSAAAYEIRLKMRSRQTFKQLSIDPFAPFTADDEENICAKINQKAYEWALSNAASKALDRFKKFGMEMVFLPDYFAPLPIGPLWINNPLSLEQKKHGEKYVLEVKAVGMKTPVESTPATRLYPDSNGYHYCKLLSPARVMEWIYTDGLRRYKGLKQ